MQPLVAPARRPVLSTRISLAVGLVLLLAVAVVDQPRSYLPLAVATIAATLLLIYFLSRGGPAGALSVLAALVHCGAIVGGLAAYATLALTSTGLAEDQVLRWGLLDKRWLVFAYLIVGGFMAFHWAAYPLLFRPTAAPPSALPELDDRRLAWRVAGAALIAGAAFCWLDLAGLIYATPADRAAIAPFYELHSHVHLGALEQIRLGAKPYLEAQTQYGLGNQLLMHGLTSVLGGSNHGFFAGNLLMNAVCTVLFFVVVQQFLGLRWAAVGLVGWVILPSPFFVQDFAQWAILTRWISLPILALLLAWLLLGGRHGWWGALAAGAIWGLGGVLSQESLSGGILILAFSMLLYVPATGLPWRDAARFAAVFMLTGAALFAAAISAVVGVSQFAEAVGLANAKSGLVMAGVSNSWWSDNWKLSIGLSSVFGGLYRTLVVEGGSEFRRFWQAYLCALLLIASIGVLAMYLGRRWRSADPVERAFVRKFSGVAVGAFVLHLFTLMRTDWPHLAGTSFLLPLFLVMLLAFAWRCLEHGRPRTVVLVASSFLLLDAAVFMGSHLADRVATLPEIPKRAAATLDIYRRLQASRDEPPSLVNRYSTIAEYQKPFRDLPGRDDAEELFALVHARLRGRPVELVGNEVSGFVASPDLFYFLGRFRSITGTTSPVSSIWLKREEEAWIARLAASKAGCLFFPQAAAGRVFDAWKGTGAVTLEPIAGRRPYGTLACKG